MKQTRQHLTQAKAAIEAVGRFTEVTAGVLGLTDGVVAAADGSLDVGEHDVDPACTAFFGGRASAFALDNGVRVAGIGEAAERRQAISVLALQVRIGYLSNVPIAQRRRRPIDHQYSQEYLLLRYLYRWG